jgi:hypothetical protein
LRARWTRAQGERGAAREALHRVRACACVRARGCATRVEVRTTRVRAPRIGTRALGDGENETSKVVKVTAVLNDTCVARLSRSSISA